MHKYFWVLAVAFFYGGFETVVLDKMWWWKTWLMVPYWIIITAALIIFAYLHERRTDRALLFGCYNAFVVLDAGYWFIDAFPHYPFPVYNWWQEWWPWNSFSQGYFMGEPLPFFGFPNYYLPLTVMFLVGWVLASRQGTRKRSALAK